MDIGENQTHHIFVPKERKIFSNLTCTTLFEYNQDKDKVVMLGKLTKPKTKKRYIFYDLETLKNIKENMNFKAISMSATYVETDKNLFRMNVEEIKK